MRVLIAIGVAGLLLGCGVAAIATTPGERALAQPRGSGAAIWVVDSGETGGSSPSNAVGDAAAWFVGTALGVNVESARLDRAPPRLAAGRGEALSRIGLDLNAVRRGHPEAFLDQRLNEALHLVGLANARELVLTARRADDDRPLMLELDLSYRDEPPGAWTRLTLSMPGPRLADAADEVWVQPRWNAWLEAALAYRRALVPAEQRGELDAAMRRWNASDRSRVRLLLDSLSGPIIFEEVEGTPTVRIGITTGRDADAVARGIAEAVGPICEPVEFSDAAGRGRAVLASVGDHTGPSIEWMAIEHRGRTWVLVAPQGRIEAVRGGLGG
ncbi:MAG: hypothetical protein KDA05_07820 [Phycisphaerales bacterium]|nr:hypothetical protein [Phycisphaerales bacterium]